MAKSDVAFELIELVQKLQDERAGHVQAIEAIDLTFKQLGIEVQLFAPTAKPRRGRPAGTGKKSKSVKATPKKTSKRTRKTFAVSGDESVLAFVKANPDCTTAQVNEHWTKEGRSGKADNALGKLVKEDKIARKNIKGQRGSTYKAK
tara:strand:+ start:61 stop:501 length:441 start_codon:yes stop_codon:yes gene_type:complete